MNTRQFKKLSHSLYECKYHIVFCPKYRYKILQTEVANFVTQQCYLLCSQKDGVELLEINVQADHVHVLLVIPPKYAVSQLVGFLKGKLALKLFDHYLMIVDCEFGERDEDPRCDQLLKALSEYHTYIFNNQLFIPNYAERYRYDEIISTSFAESAINGVVSKRMVKKQQMCWTKKGAHLLLQVRVKTLDGELKDKFEEWYPGLKRDSELTAELPLAV